MDKQIKKHQSDPDKIRLFLDEEDLYLFVLSKVNQCDLIDLTINSDRNGIDHEYLKQKNLLKISIELPPIIAELVKSEKIQECKKYWASGGKFGRPTLNNELKVDRSYTLQSRPTENVSMQIGRIIRPNFTR